MKSPCVNPTNEFYEQLQTAYVHFNQSLFDGQLPNALITAQRGKKSLSMFSPLRWSNSMGCRAHEISVNPTYFGGRTLIEVFQTLVHEQCHLWQHSFGKPSRPGYHNFEWAEKMESVGLIPSDTGKPDGKKTGQKMADYPEKEGKFKLACISLIESGYQFEWIDKQYLPSPEEKECLKKRVKTMTDTEKLLYSPIAKIIGDFDYPQEFLPNLILKRKIRYSCAKCGVNVWGKPFLQIRCGQCQQLLVAT